LYFILNKFLSLRQALLTQLFSCPFCYQCIDVLSRSWYCRE